VGRGKTHRYLPVILEARLTTLQQVIAQYYGEETPNFDKIHVEKSPSTKSYNVLRTEYWRGQQHGGMQSPVHSRHLMPMCETPSMGKSPSLGRGHNTRWTEMMQTTAWEMAHAPSPSS
jgi:hypothetical protein